MGFEGDVRESGLKPSSAAGRAVGQAPKPFPGPLAAALAAEAGPGVATLRAVSQFFLMGFEGDVRESGLKPSSAAGRAVGQAKPFPGPLAAEMPAPQPWLPKPRLAWPRWELSPSPFLWVSKVTLGSPVSNPPRQPAGPLARLQSPSRDLWLQMPAPQPWLPKPAGRGHVESCLPVLSYGFRR